MQEVYRCHLPYDIFIKLKEHVKNVQDNKDHNKSLAGNIEVEKHIEECIPLVKDFLIKQIKNHTVLNEHIKKTCLKKIDDSDKGELVLPTLWVNFQKKHEFNPLHDHSGVISFVIFIQIPYLMEDLIKNSPGVNSNAPLAGHLTFVKNGSTQPQIVDVPVDKTYEQQCFIFPADLLHCVYPFYNTDETRITISGNFYVKY